MVRGVSPPLQRILFVDFLGAFLTCMVMMLAAAPLAAHVGIAASTLQVAGALLLPFVVFVLRTARSEVIPRSRVHAIVAFNVCWFFASVALMAWGTLTLLGTWIVCLQALLVVPLVFVEVRALRRAADTDPS